MSEEKITKNTLVHLRYRITTLLRDGTSKEGKEEQFSFIFGVERQVPSLERALEGARVGDRLKVSIAPGEIYGEYDQCLIAEIPKKGLLKQRLKEGQYYRQVRQGCLVSFKVLEVRPDTVLADFNKPLAGIAVLMDVEILGARPATPDEIISAAEADYKRSIGCG